jgi:Mg2+ and Co2+ transporter CorA
MTKAQELRDHLADAQRAAQRASSSAQDAASEAQDAQSYADSAMDSASSAEANADEVQESLSEMADLVDDVIAENERLTAIIGKIRIALDETGGVEVADLVAEAAEVVA